MDKGDDKMIKLYNFNMPELVICVENGKIIFKSEEKMRSEINYRKISYNGLGAGSSETNVMGIYVDQGKMYLVLNGKIINIDNKKVECLTSLYDNEQFQKEREFKIKIDDNVVYEERYLRKISMSDLIAGDDEEDYDINLIIADILESPAKKERFRRSKEDKGTVLLS